MRKLLIFLLIVMSVTATACSKDKDDSNKQSVQEDSNKQSVQEDSNNQSDQTESNAIMNSMVLVQGGTFKNTKSNFYGKDITVPNFYIGKYEVTQREWIEVMGNNPSQFKGSDFPVEMVTWYDVLEYCNKRSEKEGLQPYYNIDKKTVDPNNKSEIDNIKWTVTINADANGYRLPTEVEWEYAAGGGQLSKSYTYSGSNNADEVAWYWKNSGEKLLEGDWNWPAIENNKSSTKKVGQQKPNELGLYDMSGNVREWIWDWHGEDVSKPAESGTHRIVKGGGWIGDVSNDEPSFRGMFDANGLGPDQGFRVVRSE
ncbi:formylglycine-generating enzyme family protein [Paenibacillus xylaniclasticus]|uniref:formylglycine-generating enzyme family protein n=1 Tax=Paenibacillus xylaniclasticus TaxID=588083 RepID=UPI000FDC9CB8|nr:MULTISPECIES: SUMF1/EgtB/PvdO family nonheme iron enzyme [Paenibacillus]GFN33916.1 hypothetical protein PCURB6_41760 [Paenibacillus curdlanolyticus]